MMTASLRTFTRQMPMSLRHIGFRRSVISADYSTSIFCGGDSESHIPRIDMRPVYNRNSDERQKWLLRIRDAVENIGFFSVSTASIVPEGLIDQVYQHSHRLHSLPDEAKRAYYADELHRYFGWTPLGEEPSYEPGTLSNCESFDVGRDDKVLNDDSRASFHDVRWPAEVEGFEEDVISLYNYTSRLSNELFAAFADMYGLQPSTFLGKCVRGQHSMMRLMFYPERRDREVSNTNYGISPHTDFECFTILHQNASGLQLSNLDGHWVEVPLSPDSFTIIIGDAMEAMTNGHLKATKHRVLHGSRARQSIVRFNGLDSDEIIQPLSHFVSATNPPKYTPITQGEHVQKQINQGKVNLQEVLGAQTRQFQSSG